MCGLCLYIKLKNALKNKNNNYIRQEVHVLPTGKKEVHSVWTASLVLSSLSVPASNKKQLVGLQCSLNINSHMHSAGDYTRPVWETLTTLVEVTSSTGVPT